MATPTSNSVSVVTVSTSAFPELLLGEKWGGALGAGVTLSYSFLSDTSWFSDPYGANAAGVTEPDSAYQLSFAERNAVRAALATWSSVANVTFVETTDSETNNGDIRFGGSSNIDEYARTYYPSDDPSAGDVWFSLDWNSDGAGTPLGSHDFLTILHEIGHALGLKHSFDRGATLPPSTDNYFYTVMSYTASPWSTHQDNFASFEPTTLMYYDLIAIQNLYGRNPTHNAGNTTYTFTQGVTYFQTIDDAGGVDTIKFSGTSACEISLRIGTFSELSEQIKFRDMHGGNVFSRDTVCIGPDTVIENAVGGRGSDSISGNGAANTLIGNPGADKINGINGNDTLIGGEGHDQLFGGQGADKFVFSAAVTAANSDTIADFAHNTDKIQVENSVFTAVGAAGALMATAFYASVAGNAHDGNDRIIYNSATGALYYDSDGTGAHAKVLIATFTTHPTISAFDVQVI